MNSYHFTFLRHGESIGNRDEFIQGRADFPLSETGIQEAALLAEKWHKASREFDAIITSPLKRAAHTAAIMAEKLAVSVSTDPLWQERSRGKFEGLPKHEAYADGQRLDLVSRHVQPGQSGESTAQLAIRAGHAVQSLFSRPPGRYLIVSHGAILNSVLRSIHSVHAVSTVQGVYFILLNTGYADYEFNLERNQWLMRGLTQPRLCVQPLGSATNLHRLILLRHGQSEGNVKRMFQGQFETPLTELGRTQAVEAGKSLKATGYQFEGIITSPMERALETAELINAEYGIPLTTDPRLKEVHNGNLAGMTIEEIVEKYPDGARPDHNNPYVPIGETGESIMQLHLRAGEIIDDLLKNPPGEYLVVAHGALLNNMVLNILGTMPVARGRPAWLMFGNTSYADLVYSAEKNLWEFLGFYSFEEK